jgi:DNA-binding NarL/FixJ family response regulator
MINVILADHQKVFRIGMASTLATEDDIRIVGQPHSLEQLICGLRKFRARVLILSSVYIRHLAEIRAVAAGQQTAILLVAEKDDAVLRKTSQEVQGVIQRSASEGSVVQCIRQLARGGRVVRLADNQAADHEHDAIGMRVRQRMSRLELKIIALVIQGCKNREIALQMGATEQGIKNALRKIFDKTGVFDRLGLALFVFHHHTLAEAAADTHRVLPMNPIGAMRSRRDVGGWPTVN